MDNVPEGVHIDFLRAERSLHRWAHEDVQRIHLAEQIASSEGAGVQMHVLEDAGHWVHTDNPDGLFRLLTPTFGSTQFERFWNIFASSHWRNSYGRLDKKDMGLDWSYIQEWGPFTGTGSCVTWSAGRLWCLVRDIAAVGVGGTMLTGMEGAASAWIRPCSIGCLWEQFGC